VLSQTTTQKTLLNLSQSKNNALETILESNSIMADEATLIAIDCRDGNLYYVHCHYYSPETIAEILKEACR
jgi:hypothetical protein